MCENGLSEVRIKLLTSARQTKGKSKINIVCKNEKVDNEKRKSFFPLKKKTTSAGDLNVSRQLCCSIKQIFMMIEKA